MTFTAKNRHQVALFLPPLVCAISVSNSFIEINTGRENRQMPCCCGSVDCAVKMTPLTAVSGGNGERSRSVCVCVCTCPYTCASVRRTGCDPPTGNRVEPWIHTRKAEILPHRIRPGQPPRQRLCPKSISDVQRLPV